jgi:hypothetical protein
MKLILSLFLVFLFSLNVFATDIDLGLFYEDLYGGISFNTETTHFGVAYYSYNDSTNIALGKVKEEGWKLHLLFRNKRPEQLKLNFTGGLAYVCSRVDVTDRPSYIIDTYAFIMGFETKIGFAEIKFLYYPFKTAVYNYPSPFKSKTATILNGEATLLINIPL